MDTHHDGTVFPEDLRKALGSSSLGLTSSTIDAAVKSTKPDRKGAIPYNEFIQKAENVFVFFNIFY